MISSTIQDALNKQMNGEFYSAWLYLSMAAWCEESNWTGAARWLKIQAAEETEHGMRIFDYLHDRGGRIVLGEIIVPNSDWVSLATVYEAALAHEKSVTQNINELVLLASQENDRGTVVFLDWFVLEQIEEEKNTWEILDRLESLHDAPGALYLLDLELGRRDHGHDNCYLCQK